MNFGRKQSSGWSDKGYTLVELMVTITVLSVVLGAVFYSYFRSQSSARRTEKVVEARQGSRAALQLLERELRMVGSGWGRISVQGCNNGVPMTLTAVKPGYSSFASNDSLVLLGAWDAQTTLRAPMT